MFERVTSTARVATARPARCAKLLATGLRSELETEFDPDTGRGQLVFPGDGSGVPTGVCDMLCGDNVLVLALEARADRIDDAERTVGEHLAGAGEELIVSWVRAGAGDQT